MKTKVSLFLVTLLLAGASAFSQTTFGIRGGVNFYNLNGRDINDDKLENKVKTGFNAGVNVEIPVGIDFYVQPGVLFTTKGAKAKGIDFSTTLNYIEIPVNFIFKPSLGDGHMLLGFGPYAAFGIGGKYKLNNVSTDVEFGDGEAYKSFDAGANLLAGYEFSNKLSFQLNAGLGLVKINNRLVPGDNDSKTMNTGFGISAGYRF